MVKYKGGVRQRVKGKDNVTLASTLKLSICIKNNIVELIHTDAWYIIIELPLCWWYQVFKVKYERESKGGRYRREMWMPLMPARKPFRWQEYKWRNYQWQVTHWLATQPLFLARGELSLSTPRTALRLTHYIDPLSLSCHCDIIMQCQAKAGEANYRQARQRQVISFHLLLHILFFYVIMLHTLARLHYGQSRVYY